jgi:hypothetical protein
MNSRWEREQNKHARTLSSPFHVKFIHYLGGTAFPMSENVCSAKFIATLELFTSSTFSDVGGQLKQNGG